MKKIPLTQGQVALVDDADYEWVSQWRWYAHWSRCTKSFYAERTIRFANGKQTTIGMHRALLGLEPGDKRQADHINHDTLDHRRENLRIVTSQQNRFNQRDSKGYHWDRHAKKFQARIGLNGKQQHLGLYDLASDARAAYLAAKAKYHQIGL